MGCCNPREASGEGLFIVADRVCRHRARCDPTRGRQACSVALRGVAPQKLALGAVSNTCLRDNCWPPPALAGYVRTIETGSRTDASANHSAAGRSGDRDCGFIAAGTTHPATDGITRLLVDLMFGPIDGQQTMRPRPGSWGPGSWGAVRGASWRAGSRLLFAAGRPVRGRRPRSWRVR
jgi:hypothetical protein